MCLHKKFPVHRGCVNAIVWNDSGNLILSGSDDRNIVLTSFTDGKVFISFIVMSKYHSCFIDTREGDRKNQYTAQSQSV